jgi:hypothetical protein
VDLGPHGADFRLPIEPFLGIDFYEPEKCGFPFPAITPSPIPLDIVLPLRRKKPPGIRCHIKMTVEEKQMRNIRSVFVVPTIAIALGSYLALAQAPPAQQPPVQHPMSFFVTSVGGGKGADLGGLAGADAHCQALATAVGRGNSTWHAYLSTQGPGAVNARDRIGNGPWYNSKNQMVAKDVGDLHGDTLDQARLGNALGKQSAVTEKGALVNGVGDTPNTHDMLTGSKPDGTAYNDGMDHTCTNWTSSTAGSGSAQLGHSDRNGGGNTSWNSTHPSSGCSQDNLVSTGGAGLFYCFAIN